MYTSIQSIIAYQELLLDINNDNLNNSDNFTDEQIEENFNLLVNATLEELIEEGVMDFLKKIGKGIKNLFTLKPKDVAKEWHDTAKDLSAAELNKTMLALSKKYKCNPELLRTVISKVDPHDKKLMLDVAKKLHIKDDDLNDFANKIGLILYADPKELSKAKIEVPKHKLDKDKKKKEKEAKDFKNVQDSYKAHKNAIVILCKKTKKLPSQYAQKVEEVCKKAGIDLEKKVEVDVVYAMTLLVIGTIATLSLSTASEDIPIFIAMVFKMIQK